MTVEIIPGGSRTLQQDGVFRTDEPGGAWIVRTQHAHCSTCHGLVGVAVTHARVTGSTGCTYETIVPVPYGYEGPSNQHGAVAHWETPEQRREAIA